MYATFTANLHNLGSSEEWKDAITDYNQAIRLDPSNASIYFHKGIALDELKRYAEITAYNQAIRLNPDREGRYS
jgi:tetratricopeptide (TPR) repeat protein